MPRRFFSAEPKQPSLNMIQQMPSYQKALEHASSHKYPEALKSLQETLTDVEKAVGPHSQFHLFLYQRMASLHFLLQDLQSVETIFKQAVVVAEHVPHTVKGLD